MSSLLTYYPGACTTKFTHSLDPLVLTTKSGPARAFPELCKDITPPCNLNPFLFNGHLQTAWTAVKFDGPPVHYKRRTFSAEDPNFKGHFTVDLVVAPPASLQARKQAEDGGPEASGLREDPVGVGHTKLPPRTTYFTDNEFEALPSEDTKPLLITLHGLSGGSYEVYLRHVLAPLISQTLPEGSIPGLSGGEWECLVVNSRGCAGSKITTSALYNARATWDVRQVVKWCRKTWPKRALFGVGYSLGANILTNYIAEEGSSCLLSAALIVSNPWKLEVSSISLQRTWVGREIYSKTMGRSMLALFSTHRAQILQNTSISESRIQKAKFLHEFDREVQCATWGYPTEGAYYRDASSADSVLAIRIPVLALHAEDDPIACDEAVPYEEIRQNPYTVICATGGGGHLSWFEFGGGRWHAKPAVAFLNAMAREVDFEKLRSEAVAPEAKGPRGGHKTPFVFEPMRRKMHVPGSDQ
ncbi:hypothetical protein LTR78_008452 [Recurvomyces mirabilis]|uniref:alcohol O-acetyltransferase n=1 Tax=Recurvomyces mirabilis TaxID=574656 RepID=A0AAE0TT83_9PEZI|nr:hypothetical protein LTR78_008452 [Recurvomyces mirabilis]KAK5155440.1 hypothetical protein LTS14_005701 [Recurvomyces mirabilis]